MVQNLIDLITPLAQNGLFAILFGVLLAAQLKSQEVDKEHYRKTFSEIGNKIGDIDNKLIIMLEKISRFDIQNEALREDLTEIKTMIAVVKERLKQKRAGDDDE